MTSLVRPAGYAIRNFRRTRGSSVAVVLALAVGMGIGTPVLGIVRNARLHPVVYTDPLLHDGGLATDWLPGWTAAQQTIPEIQGEALQGLLGVLFALAVLLLAVALVNVLALFLARAAVRRPEVALRAVLGAGLRNLVSHLVAEGTLLLLLGSGFGLLVCASFVVLISGSWPHDVPPWSGAIVNGWTIAAVAGTFGVASLLSWLAPVGLAWRKDLQRFLSTGGRSTVGRDEVITRQALAVVQIAASIVLLSGAGLLLRGFAVPEKGGGELGFDPRDTLTVQIRLPASQGLHAGGQQVLPQRIRERVATLPGVVDTSVSTPGAWLGLGTTDRVSAVCLDCWVMSKVIKPVSDGRARIHAVSPGFFHAVGAPVLRGRELSASDRDDALRVAVINDTFAGHLFPHGDALGKSIQVGGLRGGWYRVVGIVEDIRAPGIGSGAKPVPAVYLSLLQHRPTILNVAVRTQGDPMGLLPAVEEAARAVAPGAQLANALTMDQYLGRFGAPVRWFAVLFGILAGVALLLACSGLHSVMSYNVARRTREIGVRMAVGARNRDITRMIFGQSLRITGIGAGLGLFGAVALARLLQLLLGGVQPFDPLLFGGTVMLLGSCAIAASHRPARRAASVDPQDSLRVE